MRALNRSGFTLIELMIALVIGTIVGTAAIRAIVGTQRATDAGIQQVGLHQNLRAGMGYVSSVLRELDAEEGDISLAAATQLRFRGMRWASPLCADPIAAGGRVALLVDASAVYGIREPDVAEMDSVWIYADGNPNTRSDDAWLLGSLAGKVRAGVCPGNGAAALTLTVDVTAASGGQAAVLANVFSGAPLRGFQWEELSLYTGPDARPWLGQATSVAPMRPLVGPLMAAGLTFQYFDSTGAVTGVLTDIASVEVTLRSESTTRVRTAGGRIDFARDSMITRVALRNNPRY